MNEQELVNLKSTIDKAKIVISELNGQKNALLEQLKEFGCKTTEEAEKKIAEMEKDISDFNIKITQGTQELNEKYNV